MTGHVHGRETPAPVQLATFVRVAPADHHADHDMASLALARQLASTPSVSGAEADAVALVAGAMRALDYDEVQVDRSGNAIGTMHGGDGSRLLIDGHVDTIPLHSAERWSFDPFGGQVHDGRLYGLGICDQKASIAAAVHGVARARREHRLHGPVAVVASVCEEAMEGQALAPVVAGFQPDIVITTEPNDTRLGIGQRGRAKIEVTVTGRACHAGHSREGVNAVAALAALIGEAGRVEHPAHPDLGRRDLTCIDIASWPYPSVSTVPGRAQARFDCRFLPGESPGSLLALLEECGWAAWGDWPERPVLEVALVRAEFSTWTQARFEAEEFCAAWWTDEDSAPVVRAKSALTEAGLDPTPTCYRFCTNGSLTAGDLGIPTLGFGVGVEAMAHQVDEHVTLASLAAGERGYTALASHLTAGGR